MNSRLAAVLAAGLVATAACGGGGGDSGGGCGLTCPPAGAGEIAERQLRAVGEPINVNAWMRERQFPRAVRSQRIYHLADVVGHLFAHRIVQRREQRLCFSGLRVIDQLHP